MLGLFKYRSLCMLKNRTLIFWTLAFPLILTTLFASVLRGAFDPQQFSTIPVAMIDNEYYQQDKILQETLQQAKNGDEAIFKLHVVSMEEAKQLLEDKKVDAIIEDQKNIQLHVQSSDITSTMILTFFSEYEQKLSMIQEFASQGYSMEQIGELFNQTQTYIEQNHKDDNELSAVFFYTVLAMVCMFGGEWSIKSMYEIQANQSSRAARLAMTPIRKSQYLLCDFILCLMFEFVFIFIIYGYMAWGLDVSFGKNTFEVFTVLIAGCLTGNALGTLIGSISTKHIDFKDGLLTSITMLGSFLSGMMMVTVKYFVQLYAPFLNYINPVAMVTDGLYSLYYYGVDHRYYFNLLSMGIFIIVCYSISWCFMSKKRYHSLEARS